MLHITAHDFFPYRNIAARGHHAADRRQRVATEFTGHRRHFIASFITHAQPLYFILQAGHFASGSGRAGIARAGEDGLGHDFAC